MAEYLAVTVAKGEGTVVAHERLLTAVTANKVSKRYQKVSHLNICRKNFCSECFTFFETASFQ